MIYLVVAVVVVLFVGFPALVIVLGGRGVRGYDEER